MEDKQMKKIKRYLEDVIDGRDDLLQNTEKLIANATLQVQTLLNINISLSQKEAVLKYLTKAIVLFAELNHVVIKFCETEPPLKLFENSQPCNESQTIEQSPLVQNLHDFFKTNTNESMSMFDFSTSGPKVSNNKVVNDSFIRRPLDNTTLKAICLANTDKSVTNLDSSSKGSEDKQLIPVEENSETNNVLLPNSITANNNVDHLDGRYNSTSLVQEHHQATASVSPTISTIFESEVLSTVSSVAYQHPLSKFGTPVEIPKQYDTEDLDKIKENLLYLSKKMGFDSKELSQMHSQFSKNSLNYEYEEPVKEVQEQRESIECEININNEVAASESSPTDYAGNEMSQNVNESPNNASNVLNDHIVTPSRNTGAIRKTKLRTEDLIEFSTSTSDSESCDKVSTWLYNNKLNEKNVLDTLELGTQSEVQKIRQNSAIEKLHSVKRYDRNEEIREQARKDMPDLRLIPVEVPKIIKNDLNCDNGTEGKNGGKQNKIKELNKEFGVYELPKLEVPDVGAVCVFSHIVSPTEFYLQMVNEVCAVYLDEITGKLDSKYRRTEPVFKSKREAYEKVGKFCVGYILKEKGAWYRLQVLDWELGNTALDVKVKSIDYGFSCRASYTYLRPMSKDLRDIPMLAIQCHFPLLYPPGSTYSNTLMEWPSATVGFLCDITNLPSDNADCSDIKLFELLLAMLEGESLAVDLVEYHQPGADSLRTLLVDIELAVDLIEDYGSNPEFGEFFEDLDELERAENLNELVLGYDAKDEMRICKFSRKDGTCYKGKNCKLEHKFLKDGYTTDKTTVFYTAITDPIFPIKGETVQVLVTGYVDSCTYLVQMVRNPVTKGNTNIIMDRDISDLMDAMNHPKKISKYETFKVQPALGEVILAYSSLTKFWMRVVVREFRYDNNGSLTGVEVHSVDFGDEFIVKLKNTRVMLEDFMHVPFQVIQIYLDNYQHKIGCDPKKAKKFFDAHISYKNFLGHIKSTYAPFSVNLTTFRGREIGPTLVRQGFAEKRSMDILIAESSKMELY